MFKTGLGSSTFSWKIAHNPAWGPRELLEVAKREKVAALQYSDNMPLTGISDDELYLLAHEAEESGIAIEIGMRGLFVEEVRRQLDVCRALKSTLLALTVDRGDFEPGEAEIIDRLRVIAPLLEEYGVRLAIENHERLKSSTLTHVIEALESPWIGICLDTANSIGAGEGFEETVRALAPYTINLHVRDYTIRRLPTRMGFIVEGVPAGTGDIDIAWILKQIRRKGVSVIAELWVPRQHDMEQTLALEEQWAQQSLAYLHALLEP